VPRPAVLLDPADVVRFRNAEAAARFPYLRPAEPFALAFRAPRLLEAVEAGQRGEATAVSYRERGDGLGRHYLAAVQPVVEPRGRRFVLVLFEDVTERDAMLRMRADFVTNASHELRTPLASIAASVETLLGPARGDAPATQRFLELIQGQTRRMQRLIDDLLSLSRIESRAHQQPEAPVDLAVVVRKVIDAMTPLADEFGVAIAFAAPDGGAVVAGDHDELYQVFQNLIENGLKYGGEGGRLDVRIELGGGEARVAVRDFGAGIAPEHVPRLTERFYRVDVKTSRTKQGTGLGLAIVKHILARHRGRLLIESRLSEGSCFTVALPLLGSEALPQRHQTVIGPS